MLNILLTLSPTFTFNYPHLIPTHIREDETLVSMRKEVLVPNHMLASWNSIFAFCSRREEENFSMTASFISNSWSTMHLFPFFHEKK
jgi:hypothetical protein